MKMKLKKYSKLFAIIALFLIFAMVFGSVAGSLMTGM